MTSIDVPSDKWFDFCDTFSREHAGWPVTIEILSDDQGVQRLADDLPLQGISFDTGGSRIASLRIAVGESAGEAISHAIELPLHIRLAEDAPHQKGTLQVEPARGPTMLLHFHSPTGWA